MKKRNRAIQTKKRWSIKCIPSYIGKWEDLVVIWFEFIKFSGINNLKLILGSFPRVLPSDCWHSLVAEMGTVRKGFRKLPLM